MYLLFPLYAAAVDPLPWQNYLLAYFHVRCGSAILTIMVVVVGESNYYKTEQGQVKSNLNWVSVKKTCCTI